MPGAIHHPPGYVICEDTRCRFYGWPAYTGKHLHPVEDPLITERDRAGVAVPALVDLYRRHRSPVQCEDEEASPSQD